MICANSVLDYTDNYTYDLNSNRTGETTENGSGTVADTTSSSYNANNELTQSVDANSGTTVYTYDPNGSQIGTVHTPNGSTTPDSITTSEYTLQGKLAGIQNKNPSGAVTSSATYIYDDYGNRIEESTSVSGLLSSVYFLIDGNNPTGYAQVIERSATAGTPAITYIWGETLIQQDNAAGTPNAGTYYLIAGGQGSTQLLLSFGGSVVQDYYYDGFGNAIGFTVSSAITDCLYNQQYCDVISGQYYMRARNYDPATGTFTQEDAYTAPPGDTANANFYLYAGADPINMFDPSGMISLTLGTAVHQYLSRKELEVDGAAGAIDQYYKRFGNRYVSTILNWVNSGVPAFSIPFRPDMVGIRGAADAKIGDVYELKAGPITLLTQPGAIPSFVLDAATQLGDYLNLLVMAPSVHWQQGTQLWQGIRDWPNFNSALKPPGTSLVTFDYYSAVPGIILYDFIPTEKALELVAAGVGYATAAVALYQVGLELAPAVSGGLAYMADIASSIAMATLTGIEGSVA